MPLASPLFLVFLAAVWLTARAIPHPLARKTLLLVASLAFFAVWDLRFLAIVVVFSAVVYGLGLLVVRGWNAGWVALLGVGIALATLGFFKYSASLAAGLGGILPAFYGAQSWESANLFLPLGISFYSFQAISYLVDISKRRIEPVRNVLDFGLYMTFFPKAVAGPIVRPTEFFPELEKGCPPADGTDMAAIIRLLIRGLFKKIVIADGLASLAGVGFSAAGLGVLSPAPVFWRSFYLYAIQIYADFSGYTDIARAAGRMLGIPLPENFARPYASVSLTEFWTRWHMSLTQWFREYVFFPLNRRLLPAARGIRAGVIQAVVNLLTMTLIGLWHGASLTFAGWGVFHGLLLTLEKRFPRASPTGWIRWVSAAGVFHIVAVGWVLFRSDSLAAAFRFYGGMISGSQWSLLSECIPPVLAAGLAVIGVDYAGRILSSTGGVPAALIRRVLYFSAAVCVMCVLVLGWATGGLSLPFIYVGF